MSVVSHAHPASGLELACFRIGCSFQSPEEAKEQHILGTMDLGFQVCFLLVSLFVAWISTPAANAERADTWRIPADHTPGNCFAHISKKLVAPMDEWREFR